VVRHGQIQGNPPEPWNQKKTVVLSQVSILTTPVFIRGSKTLMLTRSN
jgi:hypothetical protein